MSFTRTLVSPATGGLDLRLDYGQIKVVVGGVEQITVELSTDGPEDGHAATAIKKATIRTLTTDTGTHAAGSGREVARRGDGSYAKVVVPDQPPTISSGGGVTYIRGGGISIQNVGRNMSVIGNRVFVDGVEVDGDGQKVGIRALVRVPADVDLRLDTDGADVEHEGEPLYRVVSSSQSGTLRVNKCFGVKADASSGSVYVAEATVVDARTSSGSIRIDRAGEVRAAASSGSIRIGAASGDVDAHASSGSVSVMAVGCPDGSRQSVKARASSGDVEVRDPNRLYERGLLNVSAKASSGQVTAPGTSKKSGWDW